MMPIEKLEWSAYAIVVVGNLLMYWNSLIGGFLMLFAIGLIWGLRK